MDERKINDAFGSFAGNNEKLKNAAKSGDVEQVLKNLTPEQAATLKKVLADKNAAKEILASPQAAAIMKMLFGSK